MIAVRAAAAVLATMLLITLAPSSALAAKADATEAFESISRCLADRQHLLVYALVDESASLQQTDPRGVRSTALEAMVRNLATLVERAKGPTPTVEIKMGTFATDVGSVTDWTPVGPDTSSSLLRAARGFAERDGGLDTDFATALIGARDVLDARAAEIADAGGGSVCRSLLWFTDGDYDLEPRPRTVSYAPNRPLNEGRNREVAMRAGRQLICRDGGLADDLHSSHTVTLTIGLGSSITKRNETFLEQLSRGSGGCGSIRGAGLGAYLRATDLEGLLLAFDRASTGIGGGVVASEEEVRPCRRRACPSGSTQFELDRSLDRFHLLVTAPDPLRVEIRGPSGPPVPLTPGSNETATVSGAAMQWTHLGGAILVDGELDPASRDWVGKWTVTFIDPTGRASDVLARSQVVLFGSLAPKLAVEGDARQGETSTLTVQVVDAKGTPRTPAELVATTDLNVRVTDPVSGERIATDVGPPDSEGVRRVFFDPAADSTATSLKAVAVLTVTTVAGVELPSRRASMDIPLLPPASYPRVEPAAVEFAPIAGRESGTTNVTVVGGENAGCVWFGEAKVSGPRDLGAVSIITPTEHSDQDSCLPIPAGASIPLTLTASRETAAGGTATGSMPVTLTSEVSGRVIEQDMPITVEFVRVVDKARRLEIFALVFALGMLLPLAMLWLLNRTSARFRNPSYLRYAEVPVEIDGEDLRRTSGDMASRPTFALAIEDFRSVEAPPDNQREVDVRALHLRPHVPLWPLRRPVGLASVDQALLTLGSGGHRKGRDAVAGIVPFALPSQWVLAVDEVTDHERPTVKGRLWVFMNVGTPFPLIQDDLELRLARDVPPTVAAAPLPDVQQDAPAEAPGWQAPDDGETKASTGYRPPSDSDGQGFAHRQDWSPRREPDEYAPVAPRRAADSPPSSDWGRPLEDEPPPDRPSSTGWRPPAD